MIRRIGTALMATAALLLSAVPAMARPRFGPAGEATVPAFRLFDLGVTDADADGFLDVFTTNHKFHPGLLLNDGTGDLVDVTDFTGFAQTPQFPGLEYMQKPRIETPGAYIYATDSFKENLPGVVHIRTEQVAASGRLTFGAKYIEVRRVRGGSVELGTSPSGQPTADFTAPPGAIIDIRAIHIDLPIDAEFDEPVNPQQIRVGTFAVHSTTNSFVMTMLDRHAYAFADLSGDRRTDLFSVSGGLGGGIKLPDYEGAVQDELLVRQGGGYVNSTVGSGLTKGTCRARQAAAVDINDDGRLDLFETCEGDPPKVFIQRSRGEFKSIEPPESVASTYRWINLGRGRRPELLAAEAEGIRVYAFTEEGWELKQTVPGNARNGEVVQFAVDDYNSDGEIDVLAVAPSGNTLLKNHRARLEPVPREDLGIPKRSYAASFVDYDNDGRVDLHMVPQGLLHRVQGHGFRLTGMLSVRRDIGAAITAWFDSDNDGLRDPIIVTGNAPFATSMRLDRRRNLGPGGHWLEVVLDGIPGNFEGIGSRVGIRAGGRRQYGWIGESDDSRRSQGHYRLYFGLGKAESVQSLQVRWADGAKTNMSGVPGDQVLTIDHP